MGFQGSPTSTHCFFEATQVQAWYSPFTCANLTRTSSGASAMLSGPIRKLPLTLFMRWPKRLRASMWQGISRDIHRFGAEKWVYRSLQQGSFLSLNLKSNLQLTAFDSITGVLQLR